MSVYLYQEDDIELVQSLITAQQAVSDDEIGSVCESRLLVADSNVWFFCIFHTNLSIGEKLHKKK